MFAVGMLPDIEKKKALGPLEDADIEDEDDCYDWYTLDRAAARLDEASVAGLRALAFGLAAASRSGAIVPRWGGVFGMELVNAAALGTTAVDAGAEWTYEEPYF